MNSSLVSSVLQRIAWEGRRFGIAWAPPALGLIVLISAAIWRDIERTRWLEADSQRHSAAPRPSPVPDGRVLALSRLKEFEENLPPHEDIPETLRDIFSLATAQGLILERGSYRIEIDAQARFTRYRMTLPIRGSSEPVERFILAALQEHPTLALQSVHFRRARHDAAEVEVRIQWSLLTKEPRPKLRATGS